MSQQELTRFDDYLFAIVKETGGLEGFLNTMFYFLQRRTDFFYESDPGDKMGFPPGMNKQIIMQIVQKYQDIHYKKYPQKSIEEYQNKLKQYQAIQKQQQEQYQLQQQQQQQKQIKQEDTQKIKKEEKKEIKKEEKKKEEKEEKKEEKKENVEEKLKEEQQYFTTYNGGKTDKYFWSQNINELTVNIPVKENTRPRDITVELKSNRLSIKYKKEQDYLINGEFFDLVKADECIWQIEDGNNISLTLDKQNENIWKTIIKGDSEIDATKVDNAKKLDEFDWETQGALRKVMYEQQRKQQGLPTSEEEKQMEMMKKAWNQDDSPFKGTDFDPKMFNQQQQQQ